MDLLAMNSLLFVCTWVCFTLIPEGLFILCGIIVWQFLSLSTLNMSSYSLFGRESFFFKRFYLLIHERERQRRRLREKQAPCRKPDVGLDPGAPGLHPGLKAALNR